MLTLGKLSAVALAAAVSTLTVRAAAQDDEPDDGMRRPERLTAAIGDQLLGQLARDGKTLYYVSTRNTTHEIFAQNMDDGRSRRLFDESADVTWARVSPDGKSILYVSFRDRAAGQLCVRELPDGDGRRCLDSSVQAMQAEWIDKSHVALVARPSIEGGLRVFQVEVGSHLSAHPLFDRDLTTPAVSPDGRWLVYVPVERAATRIGPAFASRAGKHLEAARLDQPDARVTVDLDLPGQTGQPVFSHDGRWVYFVQFFSDSNHDGVIDANDHGVLFRVPIALANGARAGAPEQLTDASWNCQYPAPTATVLLATCTRDRNLDLYSLPLDGEVPSEWDAERLRQELGVVTKVADQQILYNHRLARESTIAARRLIMANLVRLHLGLDEYRVAAFYAEHIAQLRDPATAGLSRPLVALVEHRRAVRERERGHLDDDFEEEARARLEGLREQPGDSRAAVALMHVVRSEMADTTGAKSRARAELAQAAIDDTTPRSVLRFYYERADAFYRETDDRDALVAVCRRFAASPAFEPDDRLDYARDAVRALTRGLPFDAAEATLARERGSVADDSELAFAIDLERALLAVRDDHPTDTVRDAIVALYARQTVPYRRSAVVLEAVRRAARMGAERITEAVALRWIDDTKPGTDERRHAERLYRRALAGRAYRRAADGRIADARADFDAIANKTGSLESIIGSIELRLRSEKADGIRADYEARSAALSAPTLAFVRAYLLAADLPSLEGKAFDKRAADAIASLRGQWPELKNKRAVRALYGSVLHQMFLRTGDLALAARANVHYLVALDLVGRNARYRAMMLNDLGMLHAAVGNYQMGLAYLTRRAELPYLDDAPSLTARMTEARALLHAGRDADAAKVADEALAMIERAPALAEYRVPALDRAALYNLAAGRFDRSLALYDALTPLVDAPTAKGSNARRNRFVTHLARAAATLGAKKPERALADLEIVEPALRDPTMRDVLQWPHASSDHVMSSYGAITAGLRANAYGALGNLDLQARAMQDRRALFAERFQRSQRNEYLRALSLVESRLADNAAARNDPKAAGGWVSAALGHADDLRAHSTEVSPRVQIDVVWLAAELSLFTNVPLSFDLQKRLETARADAARGSDHTLRDRVSWLDVYQVLTSPK